MTFNKLKILYGYMTIILISTTILFLICSILLALALRKAINRESIYVDWASSIQEKVHSTYEKMKLIDARQIFEKDDEVGVVFTELHSILEELDNDIR